MQGLTVLYNQGLHKTQMEHIQPGENAKSLVAPLHIQSADHVHTTAAVRLPSRHQEGFSALRLASPACPPHHL